MMMTMMMMMVVVIVMVLRTIAPVVIATMNMKMMVQRTITTTMLMIDDLMLNMMTRLTTMTMMPRTMTMTIAISRKPFHASFRCNIMLSIYKGQASDKNLPHTISLVIIRFPTRGTSFDAIAEADDEVEHMELER